MFFLIFQRLITKDLESWQTLWIFRQCWSSSLGTFWSWTERIFHYVVALGLWEAKGGM